MLESLPQSLVTWMTGGGFKDLLFSPLPAEDSHFDDHIFQMGWFNHQPVGVFSPLPTASGQLFPPWTI